jgi:hypothetical protein
MSNSIFENVCLNLKILSKVMSNDKLNITLNGDFNISHSTPLQCLYRFIYNDSRNKTVHYIKLLIWNANEVSQNLMKSQFFHLEENKTDHQISEHEKVIHQLEVLLREMINSVDGINNLKITYADDISTRSLLELAIDNIQTQIAVIKKNLESIRKYTSINLI